MNYFENIKKRILLVIAAIVAYIFSPIPIVTPLFSILNPASYFLAGIFAHSIQVFVFLVLLYGAIAWVKPSLVPQYFSKKIVWGIIFGLVILMAIPSGIFSLDPVGSCSVIISSEDGKTISSNSGSSEQDCIDSCLDAGNRNSRVNQVKCEFEGSGLSWSSTPEEFQGYKPKI